MSGSESAARVIFTGAGIAVAVVAMLHGSGAFAQSTGVQPTPVVSQTTITPVYDNQMLTAFARAARDISGLRNRYMPRITAANIAERTERAEALFDEMRARMHDAIDAAGLTIPDYEGISAASARDADLRSRIDTILTGGTPRPAAAPRTPVVAGPARPSVQTGGSMASAQRNVDDAAARREIADLQRRLSAAENRLQTERRQALSERTALIADHKSRIDDMAVQLAARPSVEDTAAANRALTHAMIAQTRTDAERVSLRREIAHLSRSLKNSVAGLAALGDELASGAANGIGQPFSRLDPEPVLFAGSASGLSRGLVAAQPNVVMQARLDAAQTRNLTLQATHAAQRAALHREIERISHDLSVAPVSLTMLDTALVDSQTGDFETHPYMSVEPPVGAGFKPARTADDVAG